jgi:hypothetical protein
MPVKPKKVFLFDLHEKLIQEFRGAIECADFLSLKAPAVRQAAERGSVLNGRYYTAFTARFVAPKRKQDRNPLKARAYNRDHQGRADVQAGGQMTSLELLPEHDYSPSAPASRRRIMPRSPLRMSA